MRIEAVFGTFLCSWRKIEDALVEHGQCFRIGSRFEAFPHKDEM